ncbi:translation initiation factor IF-2 [Clostridium sp. CAG:343]|nr:translation initiation factor IF-2 [Clostridium sp. CAG:343]HCF34514.1 translation initiation factor IF-2 [Clostridiales bacterium]
MGKIKIYDIAKKLNLTSKEVLEVAKKLNINVKSHLSGIEEEEAKRIEDDINKKENKKQEKEIVKKEKIGTKKEEKAPVIIRREVIISQEAEQTKKKEPVKKENKKNNVGFVERKQNKDYNIVYRNKPSKPMTVSELFGLKKEEPKKEEKVKVEQENKKEEMKKEEVKEVKKEETLKKVALDSKPQKQERENKTIGRENKMNRENRDNRQNRNNYGQNSNNYNNNNRNNNRFNHNNNRFNNNNSNNNGRFNGNNNNNGNNRFNNRNNNDRFNKRPLDEKGIEKNIKNIMSVETVEKESVREYNRGIDKQKNNNKFEENKGKKSKSRRNNSAGDFDEGKLKSLKQANRLSNMFDEQDGGMLDYYDLTTERGRRGKKRKNQNQEERTKQKIFQLTEIEIPETVTVKDLAADMKKTTAEVIKKLLGYGIMATINQEIDFDTAYLIAQEFGITATKKETVTEEDILFDDSEDKEEELETRPPVIVVMGHVDHGKTSLLDAVRKTNVIEGEAGGITQAIGAYKVKVKDREITFLDTPGHEAFTAMRARGAQITDIAILVVAANDGVKPQTIEAINHAKSAGIPIIVAINKIDLPDANIEKVKQELMAYELVPEEWGGDTIYVPISAKKGENIDQLLEMVLLEADVLELKANPHKQAKGAVIEARLDKSKGAIATMLVQRGTLDVGDTIVVGSSIGRIRAMKDDKGKSVKAAGPSTPVEIMGLTEVPEAGDTFYEVKNEKMAKHLIERRKRQAREKAINSATKVTLDNLFTQMEQGNLKVLNLIVKADVQGSVEAVKQAMEKLENEEVKVKVIHAAAGAVNQSDVTLAKVSNAIIIAFNVRPDNMAKEMAEKDEVEIKQYSIIYQAIEDVEAAMKGMLDPKYEEKVIGNAEVRQTFKISNVGTIAGCYVISGKVERNAGVRVIRENVVIHDGHLATLKRFKDDVKEVTKGFECGIQIENYNDIKEGDVIEVYIMEEIKR